MNIFASKCGHFVVPKLLLNFMIFQGGKEEKSSDYFCILSYNVALISVDGNFQKVLAQCWYLLNTPLSEAVWPKRWAQYLKITLNALKNIPDIIPSVHRVLPRGPFLPLLDEKKLPKTGSEPRTPGFTAKHTTTDLWSQAYNMYRKFCVLTCNMT